MATVVNNTGGNLGLTPTDVIPAGSEADIDDDVLKAAQKSPVVKHWFEVKSLEVKSAAKPVKTEKPSKDES